MRIHRLYLDRLDPEPVSHDVVVVIDVLRSFSTAAYAFAAGASVIYPVETVTEAQHLRRTYPMALTTGAVGGGAPIADFDFGNSPTAFQGIDLAGRPLIQSTAAGVRGLLRIGNARALFAGTLVCAQATAEAILALQPKEVALVITGEWVDRDGDEDAACADYLQALLLGNKVDPSAFVARVRDSDFGRRFASGDNPDLPNSDLQLCARVDCFNFAMPVTRVGGRLQCRAEYSQATTLV